MPFILTTTGTLDHCLLVSFRAPAEIAAPLLPRGLDLVTLDAQNTTWAFFNIVLCHIAHLRPLHTPRALGLSYHHAAYRLMVRAKATTNDDLRGLYFLRSDAEHPLINFGGNLLSDFRFHPARITTRHERGLFTYKVESRDNQANATVTISDHEDPPPTLSKGSVFDSIDEARTFLKYQPLGLCPNHRATRLRLAEVIRNDSDWREDLVAVTEMSLPYLDTLTRKTATLELATRLAPIDYRWRLGCSIPLA